MFEHRKNESRQLYFLRMVARISSLLTISVILLFLFGEGFKPATIAFKEWIGFLFFPIGLVIGLMIAWRNEGLGSKISITSLFAFYFIYGLILNGILWQGWAFILFALPSFLFFAYWLLTPNKINELRHI